MDLWLRLNIGTSLCLPIFQAREKIILSIQKKTKKLMKGSQREQLYFIFKAKHTRFVTVTLDRRLPRPVLFLAVLHAFLSLHRFAEEIFVVLINFWLSGHWQKTLEIHNRSNHPQNKPIVLYVKLYAWWTILNRWNLIESGLVWWSLRYHQRNFCRIILHSRDFSGFYQSWSWRLLSTTGPSGAPMGNRSNW